MKRIFCLLSFCLVFLTNMFAQDSDSLSTDEELRPYSNLAFGLSIGRETHHVSYLSPLLYSTEKLDPATEFWYEIIRRKERRNKTFFSLANFRAHSAELTAENEQNTMSVYYGKFDYHYYYDWRLSQNFHLLLGGFAGCEFGLDEMSSSSSNNPAYIRLDFSLLGLTLRPTLCIQGKRRVIKLADQFDFRLAGITLTPTFTEPYYNLMVTDYDVSEMVVGNTVFDKISFSNKLTVDVPLRKITLRLGMLAERQKSMLNLIDNRTLNIQALIGFTFDYIPVSGRLGRNSNLKTIFE